MGSNRSRKFTPEELKMYRLCRFRKLLVKNVPPDDLKRINEELEQKNIPPEDLKRIKERIKEELEQVLFDAQCRLRYQVEELDRIHKEFYEIPKISDEDLKSLVISPEEFEKMLQKMLQSLVISPNELKVLQLLVISPEELERMHQELERLLQELPKIIFGRRLARRNGVIDWVATELGSGNLSETRKKNLERMYQELPKISDEDLKTLSNLDDKQ